MRWLVLFAVLFPCACLAQFQHTRTISAVAHTDVFDPELRSPKSAAFSPDGSTIYINALEAGETLVYDFPSLRKRASIAHTFTPSNQFLFGGQSTVFGYPLAREMVGKEPNMFTGKPVEMAFSHNGRFLWVPYYRRSTDPRAAGPSAIGVIDTHSNALVRVFPTGPLPKFVTVSPTSDSVVVTQWGDNTLVKIETPTSNPQNWSVAQHWVVERQLDVRNISGDRDKNCGYCLRGTVFTTDGKYVLVARMGGGGIAGFDAANGRYLGTVRNIAPTPRHLVMSLNGKTLWVSSNVSGVLTQLNVQVLLNELRAANGKSIGGTRGKELSVGSGARTVAISPDEKFAFVATNTAKKIAVVDLHQWKVVQTLPAAPFPVGLATSPDGCALVSTSQGREGQGGGNTVEVFTRNNCKKSGN